jgi:hypothetical protein
MQKRNLLVDGLQLKLCELKAKYIILSFHFGRRFILVAVLEEFEQLVEFFFQLLDFLVNLANL